MKLKKESAVLRVLKDLRGGVFCVSWWMRMGMGMMVVGLEDVEEARRKNEKLG